MSRVGLPRLGGRWLGLVLAIGLFALLAGAGGAAAAESDTVGSYWRGLWWAVSLMMTEGFLDRPPETTVGALISVVLMLTGFAMLSVLSATLASVFVRSDERPGEQQDAAADSEMLAVLHQVLARLDAVEARLAAAAPAADPAEETPAAQTPAAETEAGGPGPVNG